MANKNEAMKKTRRKGKKLGRPPLPDAVRKTQPVVVRLDPKDLAAIERKARSLGLSKTEAIREAIKRFAGED